MLKKLNNYLLCNDGVDLDDIESEIAAFVSNDMGAVTIDLNNTDLDGDNFNDNDSENIIHIKLWLSVIDINNIQRVKKKGQRINVYSMACNKSVRLVYDKR